MEPKPLATSDERGGGKRGKNKRKRGTNWWQWWYGNMILLGQQPQ